MQHLCCMKVERTTLFLLVLLIVVLQSCTPQRVLRNSDRTQLHFIDETVLPHKLKFANTMVGGLSGIDYDAANDLYYLISDDRSSINPARYYTAKIRVTEKGIDTVQLIAVHSLRQKSSTVYPSSLQDPSHTPDPEAIRYNAQTGNLVWSSEGERIVWKDSAVLEDPAITIIGKEGAYIDTFALPANMHMRATARGPRQNGVFEGMSFSGDYKSLYVSVEEPLYEDGPRAGTGDSTAWIRIIKYDVATRQPVAQYAYPIDPVAHTPVPSNAFKVNGVPDILWTGKDQLLVMERSFSTGVEGCVIKVYLADLSGAEDISSNTSLQQQPSQKPVRKKLLLDMSSLGRYIDNVEGMTFGPRLPNGRQSLIFVADDNFAEEEKTQVFLFELQ